MDGAEAMNALNKANIVNASLNSVAEFLEHPALTERHRWQQIEIPGGTMQALLPPVSMSGVVPRMDPVPAAGEHSANILTELGRSTEDIAELRANGLI